MKQFLNKALLGLAGLGLAATGIVSCADNDLELYEVGEPDWLQERIDQIAEDKANSSDDEEETGFVVDLNKYKDDFEFKGSAKMIGDILLVDGSAGGKHGSYVTTKTSGWLEDKIQLNDVVTISFDARPTVNASDWNYTFGMGLSGDVWNYVDGTIGFIMRCGDPYQGAFPGGAWDGENTCGGSADENPYNYFSGLNEANCNKWYHFDYIYSVKDGFEIYMNGKKQITHSIESLDAIDAAGVKNIIQNLTKGDLHIGCGIDVALENFGGYLANFVIHDTYYYKTKNFFNGEIPDNQPKSLVITGAPSAVELNSTDFLKDAVVTVNWDNGASDVLTADDFVISTTAPMDEDGKLTTVGTYTVTVSYASTKNGNPAKPVASSYILEVTAPISSVKAESTGNVFYFKMGAKINKEDVNTGMYIKQVYGVTESADIPLPTSEYTTDVTIPATIAEGENIIISIKYKDFAPATIEVPLKLEIVSTPVSLGAHTVGAEDNTAGWWEVHSPMVKVEAGTGVILTITNYNNEAENWFNFLVQLTNGKAEITDTYAQNNLEGYDEYAILRADNYGWGAGYDVNADLVLNADHNWDIFSANLNGAKINVEVINKGTTCDVIYTYTGTVDGLVHTQKYLNVKVTGDLYVNFTAEKAHIVTE